jgi:hypothetical protein
VETDRVKRNAETGPYAALLKELRVVQRRLRRQDMARLAPLALAAALALGAALALAARFTPLLPTASVPPVTGALALLAVAGVVVFARLRPRPPLRVARFADAALDLDEKVATAIERHNRPRPDDSALGAAQLEDAAISLARALPRLPARAPLAPGRAILLAPLAAALLLLPALFAPNPLQGYWDTRQAQQQQQQAEADKIEQLRKDIAAQPGAGDAARQALLADLDQLHHDLQSGALDRDAAMARLSDAEAKLQREVDSQAPAQRAALDALGARLSRQDGALRQAGEALAQQDSKAAADALRRAGADAAALSPQQRQAEADALQAAAADSAATDPALAQKLNDAAGALQNGDPAAMRQALDNLAAQTQAAGAAQAAQRDLNQALSQIQDSKNNIAAGSATPAAGATPPPAMTANATAAAAISTALAAGSPQAGAGAPQAGGTALSLGTPVAAAGTALSGGTPVAVAGAASPGAAGTGTPALVPGQGGTPVLAPGPPSGQAPGGAAPAAGAGAAGSQAGTQHSEPVAVPPSTLNAQGTPVGLTARPGAGDTGVAGVNVNPSTGAAQVPYQQVYGAYEEQAQKNLGSTYIPSGMKDLVRRYFTAIEPPAP